MTDNVKKKISDTDNSSFGGRFKWVRLREKYTQKGMAGFLKVSQASINQYEKNKQFPSLESILKINGKLEVDLAWLITGKGDPELIKKEMAQPTDFNLVDPKNSWFKGQKYEPGVYYPLPLISGAVAAGSPRVVSEDEVDDWVPVIFHRKWCPHPEKTVCVRIAGDSMEPTIPDGGLAAIDLDQKDPASLQKKIVALRKNGGVTIKRLFLSENHYWIGRPDNPQSDEIFTFPDEEISECIIGKVVFWWGRG